MALSLKSLASILTQLALQACSITRSMIQSQKCEVYQKGEDDQVTEADYKIQSMLLKGIKKNFPYLSIVAQETLQYKGVVQYNYDSLTLDMLPKQCGIKAQIMNQEACLWVDPIDCTRGFIKGNLEDVTILIGLSNQQKACFGVIGTPYERINGVLRYNPTITIGSVQDKVAYNFNKGKWEKIIKKPIHDPIIIVSSNSRTNDHQMQFIRKSKAKNITAGGSGRKTMMVANGEADLMIYFDSWTHKWDCCAGDAIIKSMGGYFTYPSGKEIEYDHNQKATQNTKGMISVMDQHLFKKALALVREISI